VFRHAKRNSRYRFLHTSFGARVSACEFRQPDFEVRAPKRELEGEDSSATGSQSGIADRLSRMPRSFSLHSDGLVQSRVPFHFARLLPSRAITCQTIPRRKVFPAPQNCPPPFRTVFATQSKRVMARFESNSGGRGKLFGPDWNAHRADPSVESEFRFALRIF